jgi:hypothetical protein
MLKHAALSSRITLSLTYPKLKSQQTQQRKFQGIAQRPQQLQRLPFRKGRLIDLKLAAVLTRSSTPSLGLVRQNAPEEASKWPPILLLSLPLRPRPQ